LDILDHTFQTIPKEDNDEVPCDVMNLDEKVAPLILVCDNIAKGCKEARAIMKERILPFDRFLTFIHDVLFVFQVL
jgi:hypothetical protein